MMRLKKRFAQYRNSMAEIIGEEVVRKIASKQENSKTTTIIFGKYKS